MAVAKEQNLELRYGDILLVRTGYVDWHNNASHEERLKGTSFHEYPGVEASPECVEWFWDHHFAAVAADCPAFADTIFRRGATDAPSRAGPAREASVAIGRCNMG
jgi:kynurenine formamidase